MLKRCECCIGKKTIIGLGNVVKTCLVCKGIGWLEDIIVLEDETLVLFSDEKPKRGRPVGKTENKEVK